MPPMIEDSDDEAPVASSSRNVDEPASLGDLAREKAVTDPTPALKARIRRCTRPATQTTGLTDEGALVSCLCLVYDEFVITPFSR